MRIIFITDPHGSSAVLQKAQSIALEAQADLMIVGGDLLGKILVVLESYHEKVKWTDPLTGDVRTAPLEKLPHVERELEETGIYTAINVEGSDHEFERILNECAIQRLTDWLDKLAGFTAKTGIACMINPGNDDSWNIDPFLLSAHEVLCCEGKTIDYLGYRFCATALVPITPWQTPREAADEVIYRNLSELFLMGDQSMPMIVCAHTPPFATQIDIAPEVTSDQRIKYASGRVMTRHIGSRGLRQFLEERENIPLALHGHVHESPGFARIGSTVSLNPGSEYGRGLAWAYLVDMQDGEVIDFQRVCR